MSQSRELFRVKGPAAAHATEATPNVPGHEAERVVDGLAPELVSSRKAS